VIGSGLIAATAAASVWFSLGIMAVTGDDTRLRVVALPPFWLLALSIIVAATAVWFAKPGAKRLLPLTLTVLLCLPYVPGHVPAWFLIWQGPIEIAVWALAILGVLLGGQGFQRLQGLQGSAARSAAVAGVIAALAYTIGAVALRDRLPIGDEPHYLMITQSLIKDGDLRIENNHRNHDYAAFARYEIPPHYLTRGVDGEIYSAHAPGVALLVLPAFALFGYYGAVATVILCAALASALGWHAAWLLTRRRSAAWIAWAAVFLSAPMFLEAVTVFPDAVAALPVVAGLWLLIALEVGLSAGDLALMGVGLALATLPWLHTRFVPLASGLGVVIAWRLLPQGRRRVAVLLAIPAVSAALWFGFFWWIWGSPSPLAPWGTGVMTSRVDRIPSGLLGLLFDPQAGLLVPAPAYVLELAGWVVLLRSKPRLAIELGVIGGVLTAIVASYEGWWGGEGAPARYLVAALPLFVAPAAWIASRSAAWMRLCIVSVLLSLLMLSAKVYADGGAFAFSPQRGVNPLFGWMSSAVSIPSLELKPTASQLTFIQHLDATAGRASGRVHLTMPAAGTIAPAKAAARLGDVSVFFMDGRSYPEPTGFWVPGNGETNVVMARDDPDRNLGLRLQAGPIATSAIVEIDGERQTLAFTARQRHEIAIPPAAAGAWRITIRPGAGFRPVDHNPEIKDYRNLGLWIEVF
jgi:hypothetical protein